MRLVMPGAAGGVQGLQVAAIKDGRAVTIAAIQQEPGGEELH